MGKYKIEKLTSLPMCGFIAQLVEHCIGITEVMGLNLSSSSNWKIYCDHHSSYSSYYISSTNMNYFIYTSHHFTARENVNSVNKLTLLPVCGFIAQLVEHHTSIAEVTGWNPVEALNFFRLHLSSSSNWKIYCDDHSSYSNGHYCLYIFHFQHNLKLPFYSSKLGKSNYFLAHLVAVSFVK